MLLFPALTRWMPAQSSRVPTLRLLDAGTVESRSPSLTR